MKKLILIVIKILIVLMNIINFIETKCVETCKCDFDLQQKKRIICDRGNLKKLDSMTDQMDTDIQLMIITAGASNRNNLQLGRIFQKFNQLEEITIQNSRLPLIGDSTFWPGKKLHTIDLSSNEIKNIHENDFFNLTSLKRLDLSNNRLQAPASGVFQKLINLTKLDLSHNQINELVPRLFMNLQKLEYLDLSFNPIKIIHPNDLKDIPNLKFFYLQNCLLETLHSLFYLNFKNLILLNLNNNFIKKLSPDEYKYLINIKYLLLAGNQITELTDNVFNGKKLIQLNLANNNLKKISLCTFCNSTIEDLDLTMNKLIDFDLMLIRPLEFNLKQLHLSGNLNLQSFNVFKLITSFHSLQWLSVANMSLTDEHLNLIHSPSFSSSSSSSSRKRPIVLDTLDMSNNRFTNLSVPFFTALPSLKILNLARNLLVGLNEDILATFTNKLTKLVRLYLNDNPWYCFRCFIVPMLDWLHLRNGSAYRAYENTCNENESHCLKCAEPAQLKERQLARINPLDIHWCVDPTVQLRISATEPRVGLILALLIIIALIIVIIIVVIMYRKQGAVYYTHEEDRPDDKTIFTIQRAAKATETPPLSSPQASTPASSPSPPLSPPLVGFQSVTTNITTIGGSLGNQRQSLLNDMEDLVITRPKVRL